MELGGASRVDAGMSGFIYISDSDRTVPAELGKESGLLLFGGAELRMPL